jgi:hypothetical protein
MPEKFWETVLTVINGKPYKFGVREKEMEASPQDLTLRFPRIYLFDGTGQSNPKEKLQFIVKVNDMLANFANDEKGLRNAVISFGLESIRQAPNEKEFIFTTTELKRIQQTTRNEGRALRIEILKFIFSVNEYWPKESVSYVDLEDNMIGEEENTRDWLNRLQAEGLLEVARGFKKHSRARGKPNTIGYCIAAKANKEVESEIKPEVATSGQDRQDRSVHIEQAGNVQITSGDNAKISNVFAGQQVITSAQDFIAALKELNHILAKAEMNPAIRTEMEKAVTEAEVEAAKDNPEKGKIARALEKAVTLAKLADNAKELMVVATPVVTKAAGWIGEAGRHVIGLLT